MENYSRITRFCLVCNYVTRIIEPLASRCSKFRFKVLESQAAGERVEEISRAEGLRLEDGVVKRLLVCSEGDLRRAIMLLQSSAKLVGFGVQQGEDGKKRKKQGRGNKRNKDDDDEEEVEMEEEEEEEEEEKEDSDMPDADAHVNGNADADDAENPKTITIRTIEDVAGIIPDKVLNKLIQSIQGGNTKGATYGTITTVVSEIIADGWSAMQLLNQLYHRLILSPLGDELFKGDLQKNRVLCLFSEMDKRLVDGADEHLSILDLALRISTILVEG